MSPPSDDELDYLLSRGKLGGSQRARILKTALAASRDGLWRRWRARLAWSAGSLAFATGAAVLLLSLRAPRDDAAAGFQSKGAGDTPLIVMSCLGAELGGCPPGSKLAFGLEGGHDKGGFLTSFAEPTVAGERVWYLTNESVGAPNADAAPRVILKAALIGDEQPPGRYRVHAIFTRRPVAREAVSKLGVADIIARLDLDLVVAR
jgi:hypothetical protein